MAEDRGPQVLGVVTFFLVFSTITITSRCYCRAFVVKNFGLDDWFALTAWVFFALFCGFAIGGVKYGTGKHIADIVPATNVPIGLKWWWACEPVYVLSNMSLKASISVFLLRLTPSVSQKAIIYTVLLVLQLYGAIYFLIFVLQCLPPKYFWEQYTGGKGSCMNPTITVKATYAYSAISCWADWTLAILPVFLIWGLQMNPRTKIVVGGILALGAMFVPLDYLFASLASTATIIRIPYVKNLADKDDFLYATTDVAIWSTSETGIGIVAACLATLRPLFRQFLERSKLFGGPSSGTPTPKNLWRRSGYHEGYVRSKDFNGISQAGEDIDLRSDLRTDLKRGEGVTTVIGIDDPDDGMRKEEGEVGKAGKMKGSKSSGRLRRNLSERELTQRSSSEEEGRSRIGVIRTTVVTTRREGSL